MFHKLNHLFIVFFFIFSCLTTLYVAPTAQATQADSGITGTVTQTMNASGYTYMHVDSGTEQQWVAIPQADIKTGDKVTYLQGMVMPTFQSKTLNRTFTNIVFSPGLENQRPTNPHGMDASQPVQTEDSFAQAVKAETGAVVKTPQEQLVSGGSAGAMAPFVEIVIEKASGENGFTVEEIFAKKEDLNNKTVRVRGKVVKYNPNIMGKNWIHIQDGTGNPMENTHDLVITTTDTLTSEDVIVIEGKMKANKDFGAGYSYVAIVEEAKLIK